MKTLLTALLLFVCSACTTLTSIPDDPPTNTVGPTVQGTLKDSSKPTTIPFSYYNSGSPVIATELFVTSYALTRSGGTLSGSLYVNNPTTVESKLTLAKYGIGGGHNNAPLTLNAEGNYLQIGGDEHGLNSYRGIGFGYMKTPSDMPPASLYYQELNNTGVTNGSLCMATRLSVFTPTTYPGLCLQPDGQISSKTDYVPRDPQSLATKAYVDNVASPHKFQELPNGKITSLNNGDTFVFTGEIGPVQPAVIDNNLYKVDDGFHFSVISYARPGVTTSMVFLFGVYGPISGFGYSTITPVILPHTVWEFTWSASRGAWFGYPVAMTVN